MRHRYGMVHGRFQPFHLGHLEYALAALPRCEHLLIGVTNSDPSLAVVEATDPKRHQPEANPFTFFERQLMIRAALVEAAVELSRFSIVPFPIHHSERWRFYCPQEAVQFLRLYSEWGQEKARRFRAEGWMVEILDPGVAKRVSGSEVRYRLQAGQGWEELVPPVVATMLKDLGAAERMKGIGG